MGKVQDWADSVRARGRLEGDAARGGYGKPALNHFMARWRNLAVRVAMLRAEYRAAGRYDDADRLRGILEADGVIVTDRETETRLEFDGVPAGRPVSTATLIEGTIWTVTVTGKGKATTGRAPGAKEIPS